MIILSSRWAAIALAALATLSAYAQTAAPDLRALLLAPASWHVERPGGTTTAKFEARGEQLWGKFDNNDGKGIREAQITVAPDQVSWTGAAGQVITLKHDAADKAFPFKGSDDRRREYKFSPK